MESYDVVVLGAGPAGLAAGIEAKRTGARALIIEREKRPGGILKQCIHDGFGLIRFKEKLSGPEYAERYISMAREEDVSILTSTFVLDIKKNEGTFELRLVNSNRGVFSITSRSIILANGCRERTSRQVSIQGTRPAGIYSAGTAQYLVNILGYLPCKKCVILGSGDIGLIMARRLTLEGAQVVGVYEAKSYPSGLARNIAQCLRDYSIPLHLSKTVARVFGEDRVTGVEVCSVDEKMNPIQGSEEYIKCDGLILSVGLIPENEIAESLGIELDRSTKGPVVDQNFMTMMEGVFSCGNALHVNDLVDYVSESGEHAGRNAARYIKSHGSRSFIPIEIPYKDFLYVVPQKFDKNSCNKRVVLYFRSKNIRENVKVQVKYRDMVIFERKYRHLKPPEMERIELDISKIPGDIENLYIIMMEG